MIDDLHLGTEPLVDMRENGVNLAHFTFQYNKDDLTSDELHPFNIHVEIRSWMIWKEFLAESESDFFDTIYHFLAHEEIEMVCNKITQGKLYGFDSLNNNNEFTGSGIGWLHRQDIEDICRRIKFKIAIQKVGLGRIYG